MSPGWMVRFRHSSHRIGFSAATGPKLKPMVADVSGEVIKPILA